MLAWLFEWKIFSPTSSDPSTSFMKNTTFLLNRRTSGPVNPHLTPGPGIYFNAFIHVYSTRAGADNPLGTKFWWQQKGLLSLPIYCKFQNDLFEIRFYTHFNDFIHVYSLGQGQKTPWGQIFDVNRKPLSLRPFVSSFKQISLNSDFIYIF